MAERPQDVPDLYLAPVVLELDRRLEELARKSDEELEYQVVLDTNYEPRDSDDRHELMIRVITHFVDMHAWSARWDSRGLRVAHKGHSLVLGVPPNILRYLDA